MAVSVEVPIVSHPRPLTPTTPILIYLPRGPIPLPPKPPLISPLPLSTTSTIVTINYRLSSQTRYPTPVHDVVAGYDWVTKNLARADGSSSSSSSFPPITVCGELFGGSLAAMLALTECHACRSRPRIRAAALGNPLTDWTTIFPQPSSPGQTSASQHPTPLLPPSALLKLRSTLFSTSSSPFDPFASPVLFFKTPATDLPPSSPFSSPSSSDADPTPSLSPKRRSHRRFPPFYSGLVLPTTRISVGTHSGVAEQGTELVKAMRRSLDLYSDEEAMKESGRGRAPDVWAEHAAEDRVGVKEESGEGRAGKESENREIHERIELFNKEGTGLWDEEEMWTVGRWADDVVARDG